VIAAALLLAALAIRVVQVQTTSYAAPFDAGSYLSLASQVAHHGDFRDRRAPGSAAGGTRGPSAYFPPAFPYLLAAIDLISGHTTPKGPALRPARISQAVLGTVIVGLIGLVAYEAFGGSSTIALTAMALAAFYPVLIELSAILVAENLLTALMLAAIWTALRARRAVEHRYAWVGAAGVFTGLAALAHENGILLVIPLAVAVWKTKRLAPAVLVAATVLTILPWTIRNALQLHAFVPISDETGITLVGTYNPASAADPQVAYKWRFFGNIPGEHARLGRTGRFTEPQLSDKLQSQALRYIGHHPLAPIEAAFHNTLRMFELEGTFAWHASASAQGLSTENAGVGVASLWVVVALAIAGAFTRAARRAPRWMWAIPLLLALSIVLVNVETPRFREPIEPFLIMLAACALCAAGAALRRRLRRAPVGRQDRAAQPRRARELVEMVKRLA